MQALVLQSNKLISLPDSITTLSELRALSLAANNIAALPDSIGSCSSLRLLDVSSNKLASLPTSLGQLVSLKTLKLSGNLLAAIPLEMSTLSALQEFFFAGNLLQPLPEEELTATGSEAAQALLQQLLPIPKVISNPVSLPPRPIIPPLALQKRKEVEADPMSTHVAELGQDVVRISARGRTPSPNPIATAMSAQATKNKAIADANIKAAQEAAHQRWVDLLRHTETVAKDPLRPRTMPHTDMPLSSINKLISVILKPPPPPAVRMGGMGGRDGVPGAAGIHRPQALQRFKRVMQQSKMAVQLLGRVEAENLAVEEAKRQAELAAGKNVQKADGGSAAAHTNTAS